MSEAREPAEPLEAVRSACAEVARRARAVHLDAARLDALASALAGRPPPPARFDAEHHHRVDAASTLAYFVTLDTINFGSGWFPVLRKRPGLSGYFTIASALKERFDRSGPWQAGELRAIRADDLAPVLGQDARNREVAGLLERFAAALRELGAFLLERHHGRFEGPVEEAGGSAASLVRALQEMTHFRDVSRYQELTVPFYKRAQLLCSDLATALGGCGLGRFRDLDRLTIFADNLVPHVLRCEGVLVYAPGLASEIEAGREIPAGSPEEVEIRACAVAACERLVAAVNRLGGALSAHELDHLLWTRGQRPEMKARPRHRTRCVAY